MFSKSGFWLLLIIASALLVRLYHITYPINDMHDVRQTQTAGLIRDYYRHGINLLYPTIITLGKPGYLVLEFPIYQAIWRERKKSRASDYMAYLAPLLLL
ncbi:MAG: hypothetical protein M0Z52_06820 [Actinomycetota bacterium]|nr:hypothetical protein [Actinomycetota bacterium]